MPSVTQQTREDYFPDAVQVLFIGESPPAGGTFFYYANSNLFRATRDAFAAAGYAVQDGDFLRAYQRAGCYLEDLAVEPVDKLPRPRRKEASKAGVVSLADRITSLTPPSRGHHRQRHRRLRRPVPATRWPDRCRAREASVPND